MPAVRGGDPPGGLHEPLVLQLPALPAATTGGALSAPGLRLTAHVKGRVQGVGFRWWTRARALELGLVGTATNLADGRVEVVAEGPEASLRALVCLLRGPGTPGEVVFVGERYDAARGGLTGFAERALP